MALRKINTITTFSGDTWEARLQGGAVTLLFRGHSGPLQLPEEVRPKGSVYVATPEGLLKLTWKGELEPLPTQRLWQNVYYNNF